jgi:chromosome segregation ATPase
LRDVILLKNVLMTQLKDTERTNTMRVFEDSVPSLDLKEPLALHAPPDTFLEFDACGECGGTVEVLHKDSKRLKKLEASLAKGKTLVNNLRSEVAVANEKQRIAERNSIQEASDRQTEKTLLYNEIRKMKSDYDTKAESQTKAQNRMLVLQAEVTDLQKTFKEAVVMRERIASMTVTMGEKEDAIKHLEEGKAHLEHTVAKQEAAAEKLGEENAAHVAEILVLKKDVKEYKEKLDDTEAMLETTRDDLRSERELLGKTKKKLEVVREEKRSVEEVGDQKLAVVVAEKTAAEEQVQSSKNEQARMTREMEAMQELLTQTTLEREQYGMIIEEKNYQLEAGEDVIADFEDDLEVKLTPARSYYLLARITSPLSSLYYFHLTFIVNDLHCDLDTNLRF